MARIEGIRIQNYGALRNVVLGKLWNLRETTPLTAVTAVIGKNGAGKSTLFDAFGFLGDCLKLGVEEACDTRGRGGFQRVRSQGVDEPIRFEIYYREHGNARPITYEVAIDVDKTHRPYVVEERLRQRRRGQKHGRPYSFLILKSGQGLAWKGDAQGVQVEEPDSAFIQNISAGHGEEATERETVELATPRVLGIATLGTLKQHTRIAAFRAFIERWHLSYFAPDAARGLPFAGPQPHLNTHGDNLGNVVQFMQREHPRRFERILKRIAARIPGIDQIDTLRTQDGRLLLRFNDHGFSDPFYAQQMSDGTLKLFAYLLLLEDPDPPPLIGVEEPENGLYHKLLAVLASEFRSHAKRPGGPQIFVTTHQPYFVDALSPSEVWVLKKCADGFSKVFRASDDPTVQAMVDEGLPLGSLWFSDYLDGV